MNNVQCPGMLATVRDDASAAAVEFVDVDGQPWVVLTGELDHTTARGVADADIERHCRPGRPMLVDARAVTFLDSAGIGLLVRLHNADPGVSFVGPIPERMHELLAMTGLTQVFGLAAD